MEAVKLYRIVFSDGSVIYVGSTDAKLPDVINKYRPASIPDTCTIKGKEMICEMGQIENLKSWEILS